MTENPKEEKKVCTIEKCNKNRKKDSQYCRDHARYHDRDKCGCNNINLETATCPNGAINDSKYCNKHQYLEVFSEEQLKNMKRCGGCKKFRLRIGSCQFCQVKKKSQAKSPDQIRICEGISKNGDKCSKHATNNSDFCMHHQNSQKIEITETTRKCSSCKNNFDTNKEGDYKTCQKCRSRKNKIDKNKKNQKLRKCEYCGTIFDQNKYGALPICVDCRELYKQNPDKFKHIQSSQSKKKIITDDEPKKDIICDSEDETDDEPKKDTIDVFLDKSNKNLICEKCKNPGKYEINKKFYCGLHNTKAEKEFKAEQQNKKLCGSRYSCDNLIDKNEKKCNDCKQRERDYENNRYNNVCEYNNKVIKNLETKEGLKFKCTKCRVQFDPFKNKKDNYSYKCPTCYQNQAEIEDNRGDRDRKEQYKEYDSRPEVQDRKKKWKENNPEKMAQYDHTNRAKQIGKLGLDGYRKKNAENQANWRNNNKEKQEEINRKSKLSAQTRISSLKNRAEKSGIKWNIDTEWAKDIITENKCYYCGGRNEDRINGLDRIDNDFGYEEWNVVSCCKDCNIMKNTYSLDFWLGAIKNILIHQKKIEGKYDEDYAIDSKKESTFSQCKYSAKKRKIEFDISEKEFYELVKESCYLCGRKDKKFIGIDRIDSGIGYEINNVKPCCGLCNQFKNVLTFNQFVKLLTNINKNEEKIKFLNYQNNKQINIYDLSIGQKKRLKIKFIKGEEEYKKRERERKQKNKPTKINQKSNKKPLTSEEKKERANQRRKKCDNKMKLKYGPSLVSKLISNQKAISRIKREIEDYKKLVTHKINTEKNTKILEKKKIKLENLLKTFDELNKMKQKIDKQEDTNTEESDEETD